MKKNKQKIAVTLLLFLLCVISIGYAILQSSLDITGTTAIQDAKWDIHWNNVQITDGSVTGANVTTPATIDSSKTTVNYNEALYVVEGVPEEVDVTFVGRKMDVYLAKQYPEFAKYQRKLLSCGHRNPRRFKWCS